MEVIKKRGRPLELKLAEGSQEVYERYRREKDPELRARWHALWLISQGSTEREASRVLGVNERSVRLWVSWYRQGGLKEIEKHRRGGRQGQPSRLSVEQRAQLRDRVAEGSFHTAMEAVRWVEETYGRSYTQQGMYSLFRRSRFKKKVPRPIGAKADPEAQEAWKKGVWLTS